MPGSPPRSMNLILNEGDLRGLTELLRSDPKAANRPVGSGDHRPHPIHAICDRIFDRRLPESEGLALVEALMGAGANLAHIHSANGDGLLASALSLSCPMIARMLLTHGAPFDRPGLFQALPIHWAAIMGVPEVLGDLIARGSDFTVRDREFASTPLGWAIEGWASPPNRSRGEQVECAARLVKAGAIVEPQWKSSSRIREDQALCLALGLN